MATISEVKKIVRNYVKKLETEKYPVSVAYLFGSYAKGKAHKWSDIDVAIISNKLKKNYEANRFTLWKTRRGIDTRIEPHGFTISEFEDNSNPMSSEIRKTGIRII